jgi:hypothetical protein
MRGDKQRLLYKGRRRSRRFTILGDTAFEYDCILEREPVSNVISLLIEGAESFNFYKQPDYVPDEFLKGSYAVYKKDTLVGEGTGKLCHIHRPEIIDARGRRCWGELAVIGNELRITIPEWFLSEVNYPVIVDPTIGTTTIGKQTHWDNVDNESYDQLIIETSIAVNRFLLSDTFNGTATAYVYAYEKDYEDDCKPVIYSDNSNSPLTRRSSNEGTFDIAVGGGKPAGWRSTSFQTNTSLASGSYIWFGISSLYFAPRFDYGTKCYIDYWDHLPTQTPNTFPLLSVNDYYNFKLSMYFSFSVAGQNYQRILTQGVTLSDSRTIALNYKRVIDQSVHPEATIMKFLEICKSINERLGSFDIASKMISFCSRIQDTLYSLDIAKKMFLHIRQIQEVLNMSVTLYNFRALIRGLYDITRIEDETKIGYLHYRMISETAQVVSSVLRGMVYFAHIITVAFVRDYLLSRFLKAKTEITLKSCVVREIKINSKIN